MPRQSQGKQTGSSKARSLLERWAVRRAQVPRWAAGAVAAAAVLLAAFVNPWDGMERLERITLDWRARLTAPAQLDPRIELVVMEEQDRADFGPWPWRRGILARAVEALSAAGAGVIGLTFPLNNPQEGVGLQVVRELKTQFEGYELGQPGPGLAFYRSLSAAVGVLDEDRLLHGALVKAENVVLPLLPDRTERVPGTGIPDFARRIALREEDTPTDRNRSQGFAAACALKPPVPLFAETAATMGYLELRPDPDGVLRRHSVLRTCPEGLVLPSYPLALARLYQGFQGRRITVQRGEFVGLLAGTTPWLELPADEQGVLLRWQRPGTTFRRTSFGALLNGTQPDRFQGKIVLIGPGAGAGNPLRTPVNPAASQVEVVAQALANLLDHGFVVRAPWNPWGELGIWIVLGLFVSIVLPRVKPGVAAGMTGGLIAALRFVTR